MVKVSSQWRQFSSSYHCPSALKYCLWVEYAFTEEVFHLYKRNVFYNLKLHLSHKLPTYSLKTKLDLTFPLLLMNFSLKIICQGHFTAVTAQEMHENLHLNEPVKPSKKWPEGHLVLNFILHYLKVWILRSK